MARADCASKALPAGLTALSGARLGKDALRPGPLCCAGSMARQRAGMTWSATRHSHEIPARARRARLFPASPCFPLMADKMNGCHEQWHPFFFFVPAVPAGTARAGHEGGLPCAFLCVLIPPCCAFFCLVRLRGADCCCRTGRRPAGRRRCGHGTMTRHGRWDMPYSSRRS